MPSWALFPRTVCVRLFWASPRLLLIRLALRIQGLHLRPLQALLVYLLSWLSLDLLCTFTYPRYETRLNLDSTSPTAYNIFTAYSVTSTALVSGGCSVISGPPVQLLPVSVPVPTGNVHAGLASALQSLINQVGATACNPGGENPINAPTSTNQPVQYHSSLSQRIRL